MPNLTAQRRNVNQTAEHFNANNRNPQPLRLVNRSELVRAISNSVHYELAGSGTRGDGFVVTFVCKSSDRPGAFVRYTMYMRDGHGAAVEALTEAELADYLPVIGGIVMPAEQSVVTWTNAAYRDSDVAQSFGEQWAGGEFPNLNHPIGRRAFSRAAYPAVNPPPIPATADSAPVRAVSPGGAPEAVGGDSVSSERNRNVHGSPVTLESQAAALRRAWDGFASASYDSRIGWMVRYSGR